MWTYMMAAARGDRANSMMSSRRRNETESPKYGYNLSRPMYRSMRHNNGPSSQSHTTTLGGSYPYTTATSHYGAGTSATAAGCSQKLQQQQQHQQQHHHHIIGIDDDVYTNPVSNVTYDMEDGTSLFSPLAPTSTNMPADTAVLIARKHHLMSSSANAAANSQLLHPTRDGEMMMDGCDEQQSCYVGSQASVVRLPSASSRKLSATYYNESDEDDDYAQIVRCSSGDSIAKPKTLVIDHERRIRKQALATEDINAHFDDSVDDDEDDDDDDEDDDAEDDDIGAGNGINKDSRRRANYLENGKRMSQAFSD